MQSLAFASSVVHPRFMSKPSVEAPTPEAKLLGRALMHLRQEMGLSRAAASEAFGTSEQNFGKYERGEAPSLHFPEVQQRLTAALGTTVEALMLTRARLAGDPAPRPRTAEVYDFRAPRAAEPASLPIRHRLLAAWMLDDEGAVYGHYHLGRDARHPGADQWLAEVLDDHAEGLRILRGDLVHLVAAEQISYWPRTGDVVEVERRRDQDERELMLRQVEVTATETLLWARSPDPRLREPLVLPADPRAAPDGPKITALLLGVTRRF